MNSKILIVDGSSLLFQMFFGMPARIYNAAGVGVWGVLGFVGALLKIIRQTRPTHMAVLFDGEHENVRASMDESYKANRPDYSAVPEEENPYSQLPYVKQALSYLGIAHAETTDCEADDWIAGYALRYGGEHELVIASLDSDFFQLISDTVSVLRYRGRQSILCTPEYLRGRFGIEPCQYADFKALTGDHADNIRGAQHVGPKTAAALLAQFGTLERILQSAEQIAKPSVRASIRDNAQRLMRNYALIKLSGWDALPFTLDEMAFTDAGLTTTQALQAIGLKE